jgi:hypothetical protein
VEKINLRTDTVTRRIPLEYGMGMGYGKWKKWFVGVEWKTEKWSSYSDDFFTSEHIGYADANFFKIGGFWLPDYRSHVKYYKRIIYKAGIHYKQGDLLIDNKPVNEFGITFGLSLPMSNYFSKLNLGLEYLNRNAAVPPAVKENIFKLKIGISLNDIWFVKRKIY